MKSTEKSVKNMPFSLLIFEHNEILNGDKIDAPLLELQRCLSITNCSNQFEWNAYIMQQI